MQQADTACGEVLQELQFSSLNAKKESDAVEKIKAVCVADREQIAKEKADAEADLAKAQPYVDEANDAIMSINTADLVELKNLPKPSPIIKLVFDCVLLLLSEPVMRVTGGLVEKLGIGSAKRSFEFLEDSYAMAKRGLLSDANFLKRLLRFSEVLHRLHYMVRPAILSLIHPSPSPPSPRRLKKIKSLMKPLSCCSLTWTSQSLHLPWQAMPPKRLKGCALG